MNLEPAYKFTIEELCALFNDAFKAYVGGEIQFNPERFYQFCSSQTIHLSLSRVLVYQGQMQGIALIARRGWSSRLVAMGMRSELRHQGFGFKFMQALIQEVRDRQDKVFELEVIEQNPAAVKLYEKVGFVTLRRLVSAKFSGKTVDSTRLLETVDIALAARFLASFDDDLPWQMGAFNLMNLGEPNRAYQLGNAFAIISSPEAEAVRLIFLGVSPRYRRRGEARALWKALVSRHPNKNWSFPALCPEESFGFFERQGFERDTLSQFHMRLDL